MPRNNTTAKDQLVLASAVYDHPHFLGAQFFPERVEPVNTASSEAVESEETLQRFFKNG